MVVRGGGILTQGAVSIISYITFAIASLFDKDIKADMDAIGWDPFNFEESKVVQSEKVSFYKGIPVIKFSDNILSSFSFYAIFYNKNKNRLSNTVFHEYGHTIQARELDPLAYMSFYGLPSMAINGLQKVGISFNVTYLDCPWERSADIFSLGNFSFIDKDIIVMCYFVITKLLSE